jgi:hypothetical protein
VTLKSLQTGARGWFLQGFWNIPTWPHQGCSACRKDIHVETARLHPLQCIVSGRWVAFWKSGESWPCTSHKTPNAGSLQKSLGPKKVNLQVSSLKFLLWTCQQFPAQHRDTASSQLLIDVEFWFIQYMTDWIIDWLTPLSKVILEKLIDTKLTNQFPAFYGTWRVFTMFTRTHNWSLSWATWIHFTPSLPVSLWSILI